MAGVPEEVRWVFWDVDAGGLDTDAHANYILPRILEFGGIAEVRWAVSVYGMEKIHWFFREVGHPELSDRTVRFWRAAFKAEKEVWASPRGWRKSSDAPWIG